jgi:hypothetical protein
MEKTYRVHILSYGSIDFFVIERSVTKRENLCNSFHANNIFIQVPCIALVPHKLNCPFFIAFIRKDCLNEANTKD